MYKKQKIVNLILLILFFSAFYSNAQQLPPSVKAKVDSLDNAATNLIYEGLFDAAVENMFEAGKLCYNAKGFTKATDFFEKAKKLGKNTGNSQRQVKINNYLTAIYHDKGDFESALGIYNDNLQYYRKNGQKKNEAEELLKIADALAAIDRTAEALQNAETALKIGEQLKDSALIFDCFLNLADNYKKNGNDSKYKLYIGKIQKFNYSKYKNVDISAEDPDKLSRLKAYNVNEKRKRDALVSQMDSLAKLREKTLAETKEESELKDAKIAQQTIVRNFIIVILIIVMLFSILFFYQNQQRKKANILLEAKNVEINKQKIELERLSIVASGTDNAVMIMDEFGNFEWVNESYTRLFGMSLDQLVNNKSKNIIGNNTPEDVKKLILDGISDRKTVSYNLTTSTPSGKSITVQATITPILDENGNIRKLIAIDSDITKIVEAEAEIKRQAYEIMQKSEELQQINSQLDSQNKHITGSITYARTIQRAIMPAKAEMDNFFDSFLIYKPKDIVSGDFAWFSKIEKSEKSKAYSFVAIVDCTGHGVPGAFMSMIGSRLLNEIVNEKQIIDPSEVLELLNIGVQTALRQKDTDNNDGMDVCLCRLENMDTDENLDKTKGHERNILVTFSGAKRPLFYFKDENEIETIRGDRKSIGGVRSKRSSVNFTNAEIVLKSGDWLYLTTDGIIDQNGIDRKRFGSGRFVEVLTQMRSSQPEEQGKALDSALIEYQDKEEQRDDITVLGIRL